MLISPSPRWMRWIGSNLKAPNLLPTHFVIVNTDGRVNTPYQPVGHACGAAGLHDAITKVRLANPRHSNVEIEDIRCQAAVLDGCK